MIRLELEFEPSSFNDKSATFKLNMGGVNNNRQILIAAFLTSQIGIKFKTELILDIKDSPLNRQFAQLVINELRLLPGQTKVRLV